MTQRKTRVAVVFGGRSTEHAVSCVSASSVLAHLDRERFEVIPIGITPEGAWVLGTGDPAELEIHDRALPQVSGSAQALALPGDPTAGGLVRLGSRTDQEPPSECAAGAGELFSSVDVVFPALHGAFGEDGTIQGLLEMAGLPYAGAGVLSSAVAMDKEYAKKLLRAEGLEVGRFAVLRRNQSTLDSDELERLGLPLFVKPCRAGSSVGVTRVTDIADLDDAISEARRTDPKVIVEAAVSGREVECGVLEFPDGRVEASLPAEIRMAEDGSWYDFDSKYLDDVCEFDIPAKIGDDAIEQVRQASVRAFRALECQGLARVDFFVADDGRVIVNEVNTMPGFTPISLYPRMWSVTGVDYPTLLSTLVDTAIVRGTGLR